MSDLRELLERAFGEIQPIEGNSSTQPSTQRIYGPVSQGEISDFRPVGTDDDDDDDGPGGPGPGSGPGPGDDDDDADDDDGCHFITMCIRLKEVGHLIFD